MPNIIRQPNVFCTSCGAILSQDEIWAENTGSVPWDNRSNEVLCEYCYQLSEPSVSGSYEGPDPSDEDYWDQMLDENWDAIDV